MCTSKIGGLDSSLIVVLSYNGSHQMEVEGKKTQARAIPPFPCARFACVGLGFFYSQQAVCVSVLVSSFGDYFCKMQVANLFANRGKSSLRRRRGRNSIFGQRENPPHIFTQREFFTPKHSR